jgi:DNA-binding MarR family transcriptional regulator
VIIGLRSDPGVCLVQFLSCHASFYRLFEREIARKLGLRLGDLRCLVQFGSETEIPVKRLTRLLGLSSSRVSGILDRLEKRRMIKREIDLRDRRSIIVHATGKGRRSVEDLYDSLLAVYRPAVVGIDPAELATANRALEQICLELACGVESGVPASSACDHPETGP